MLKFFVFFSFYHIKALKKESHERIGVVVKTSVLPWEVWGLIPGPVNRTQSRQRLATAAMFVRSCVDQALSRGDGPRHSSTLQRNTSSIMKVRFHNLGAKNVKVGQDIYSIIQLLKSHKQVLDQIGL